MFKPSNPRSDLNGVLDQGSHIHGELRFDNEFRIMGKLTGSIVSEGELQIGDGGEIEGDLEVRRVIVSGTLKGTLRASERIHITSSGRVFADLHTPSLTIEEGAFFEGHCSMGTTEQKGAEATGPKKVTKMPIAQRR